MRRFFTQYREIIVLTIALIVVFWAAYALRSVLLPFFVGLIAAYVIYPAVVWTEKRLPRNGRWMAAKRVSIIVLIYLIILGILALIGYFTIPGIVNSTTSLIQSLPGLVPGMVQKLQDIARAFQQDIPPEVSQQVDTYLSNLLITMGNALQSAVLKGLSYIPGTVGLVLGFASLPIFVFYIVKDAEKLQSSFISQLPPWLVVRTRDISSILQDVLGRYIRAQLLMGVVIGVVNFIWLTVLGIPYSAALALLSGAMELVPVLGPWIAGSVGVLVTLATHPDRVVWVIIAYAGVQLLEGNLLSPRVNGSVMRINPAVVVLLIVLGANLAGLWGVILAVPLTATLIPIYQYLRRSSQAAGTQDSTEI